MTKEEAASTHRLLTGLIGTIINGKNIYALMIAPYGGENFQIILDNYENARYDLNNAFLEQCSNFDIYALSIHTEGDKKGRKSCTHIESILDEIFLSLKPQFN